MGISYIYCNFCEESVSEYDEICCVLADNHDGDTCCCDRCYKIVKVRGKENKICFSCLKLSKAQKKDNFFKLLKEKYPDVYKDIKQHNVNKVKEEEMNKLEIVKKLLLHKCLKCGKKVKSDDGCYNDYCKECIV